MPRCMISAEAWYQDRDADTPKLVTVTAADLSGALARANPVFDFVLIDTPYGAKTQLN